MGQFYHGKSLKQKNINFKNKFVFTKVTEKMLIVILLSKSDLFCMKITSHNLHVNLLYNFFVINKTVFSPVHYALVLEVYPRMFIYEHCSSVGTTDLKNIFFFCS